MVATSLSTPAHLPTGDPRAHPAYPGQPRGRASHCPTTSHDDGHVQADASCDPTRPIPASIARFRPGRRRTGRGYTGRPWRPRPAATLHDLTPVGHSGRGNARTPDAHTGHGHRTPVAWTGRVDNRTLAPDTGRGRGRGDEGTVGISTSCATTPSGPRAEPATVFLWKAPAALGNHDGSAVGQLGVRDCLSHHQAAARSLRRLSRASAHCSPQIISGGA